MQNYTILKELGSGAYGIVYKAQHKQTQQIVALKQIHQKTNSWNLAKNQIELRSFQKIKPNLNIVTLYEAFREKDGTFYFVFEFVDAGSLYDLLVKNQKLSARMPEVEIRQICFQVLQGLDHMHSYDFMHRDLKPENVLLQHSTEGIQITGMSTVIPKIADLGCAKETRQRVPIHSLYAGTRWYRSIELLMKDQSYGKPNDVWAIGCVFAELFTNKCLFPGNSELDQINMILGQLGPLYDEEWPQYQQLASKMNFVSVTGGSTTRYQTGASHNRIKQKLTQQIKFASDEAMDCLSYMLELNPDRRCTTDQLLNHKWFQKDTTKFARPPSNQQYQQHESITRTKEKIAQMQSQQVVNEDFGDYQFESKRSLSNQKQVSHAHINAKDLIKKEEDVNLDFGDFE
ncbi:Kinase, CMGC RCK [Spironucleus salmonicida]|uniref:Kinase, CMGC RCK n=1 Tax=Spironucleus salmonicida TaxID=348837 RepID=V6LXS1_9EUKA|nr:Kinase, CMGC RCK [Spironucleus salmonicida]|eukprot:EST49350.1 Kinase, CMGC RCK [Spironucleus salmonicida]